MTNSTNDGGSGCGFLVVFLFGALLVGGWLFRTLHVDTLLESPGHMGLAGLPVAILLGVTPWVLMGVGAILIIIALTSNKSNPVMRIAIALGGFASFAIGFNVAFRALF